MMRVRLGVMAGAVLVGAAAEAAVFAFDPTSAPANNQTWYSLSTSNGNNLQGCRFGGTSWGSDGSSISLTTAPGQGIWIGNLYVHRGSVNTNWAPSNNTVGNEYSARLALTPGSKQWSFYLADGTYGASFSIDDNTVSWYGGGAGGAGVVYSAPLNATQFHMYSFLLKGGLVRYQIDGATLYAGPAYTATYDFQFLIGDGSGSTPTGSGSMTIDSVNFNTAPVAAVPEPGALLGVGIAVAGLAVRRRA